MVTRMGQSLYRDVLPVVPGVPAQLKSQSRAAMRTVRDMALDTADPSAAGSLQPGATPAESMQALRNAFNNEYESTVGQYSFSVPKDLTDMVEARIKAAQSNVDDTTLDMVSRAVAAADVGEASRARLCPWLPMERLGLGAFGMLHNPAASVASGNLVHMHEGSRPSTNANRLTERADSANSPTSTTVEE